MKSFQVLIISILVSVNLFSSAFAQDVTLSWDPSPSSAVTGYKIYYKAGDLSLPLDGTGAAQGPSPVDVGNALTTSLTELTDGTAYYFAVTAYDGTGNESTFSNIVSNTWMPQLLTPEDGSVNEPIPVTFRWQAEPDEYNVIYTLTYGTDEDEVTKAGIIGTNQTPNTGFNPRETISILLLAGLILLLAAQMKPARKGISQAMAMGAVVLLAGMLAACGGSGGGDSSTSGRAASDPSSGSELYTVEVGSADYYQAFDLAAGTTYYWKITATDTVDFSQTYKSEVKSFTTETY